jgi:glycosyltransferase involved in cell wall biosynthesis
MGSAALRIALVASPVTPLGPAQVGGSQSVVSDLAQGLTERGHSVTVHCASGSEIPGVDLVQVEVPAAAGRAALVRPGGSPSPRVAEVDAAIAAMFDAIERRGCDVIGQHAFDVAAFEASAGRPVLHTLHLPPVVPAVVDAARAVPASRLAAVSEAGRRDWAGAGVRVQRVIRNGVRSESYIGIPVRRCALFAGRLSPEKGIEDAIRACAAEGIPLRIAGSRYDPGYAFDMGAAEYLGVLPRADLRKFMAESAVFLSPVRWEEPFGLAAAEAQMAGCPVAAYRRGAMPEIVEEGVSGYLAEPDDVAALRVAMKRCMDLNRESVRTSALARLGIDAMLDAYESAYAEVAG